jgi:hypothetical protein
MELKKGLALTCVLIGLFLISSVSALSLEVEKVEKAPVVISELKDPAIFDFIIDNNGGSDEIRIYSLVGATFEPDETFHLPSGKSTIEVKVYPAEDAREKEDNYAFEYQIKGSGSDIFKDTLTVKIVKLGNVLDIEPLGINYGDEKAIVRIRNVNNIELDDIKIKIKSVFYENEKTLSFKPFESINLSLSVNTENTKELAAGSYVVTSDLELDEATARVEETVNYKEKQVVAFKKEGEGWVIRTTKITKTNEGNLAVPDTISVSKNILTRLFTTFSAEPLTSERKALFVYYSWEKDLNPGESWDVEVTTNYTLPFILVILVIFSAGAVYLYSRTALVVSKRCSFVKTKGGEFALKVILHIKARKALDNIEIFDRIPMATKLYEKAGMPHKFDEHLGRLSWKIDRLNAGEDRIFSYIIYSTIRIVGRLELSPATAHFVKDGKPQYVNSNRTFFMSEIHPRY